MELNLLLSTELEYILGVCGMIRAIPAPSLLNSCCKPMAIPFSLQVSGGVDWRVKLDNQRGAVLATELKNNSCKLAKWTVGALLAGSDQLKFG